MSGTSLDGVDLVFVEFDEKHDFKILEATTIPYPKVWEAILKDIAKLDRFDAKLKQLDVELGRYYGVLLQEFIKEKKITYVDVIASHGHTVHHQPAVGYTLQIGSGFEIFKKINVKTVFNFREQDVLLGGQGAPLVPVGDEILFSAYDYCLNLGGFSNVSFDDNGVRKAFDICAVNTVLNFYANKLGKVYDDRGVLARSGQLNKDLLKELNKISFYQLKEPKSLGVEFLEQEIFPILNKYNIPTKDVLRTYVEHIAMQLVLKIEKGTVLVTGGGAYHTFLIERVQNLNPLIELVVPSSELVEYKEALVFALLGRLKILGLDNCFSSVTGAVKNHSCGVVIA